MIRRHSLADISSLSTDPYLFDSLGYPHNTYHDPNNEFTIYTLRRASSPVMLPTAPAMAVAAATPEVDGQPDQPKSAKKKKANKKKKKKANSRNSNKGEGKENGVVGVEGVESVEGNVNNVNANNASMPLIVNGASLKHRADQMSEIATEVCPWILTVCGCVAVTKPNQSNEDDGLQRFINSHRPPLYTTQSPAPIFTPSVATTEDTIRASSVSENHQQQHHHHHPVNGHGQVPPVCPEHGRTLCQFLPGCCVHRWRGCQGCLCHTALRSCCCVHHAGDCCYCVFLPNGTSASVPGLHAMPTNGATESSTTNRTGDTIEKTTTNSSKTIDQFTAHALTLLENEEFCDYRIVLKSSKENFYPITFRAHKALLARSPRLKTILSSSSSSYTTSNGNNNNEIEAITGETFCMVKAFETALQNLYGLPILDAGSLRHAAVTALGYNNEEMLQKVYPFPLHAALADFAMCYAASGAFFEMKEIVEAGVRLASEVLHWENVEMVLYFALCVSAFIITLPTGSGDTNNESTTVVDLRDIYAPRLTTAALTFLVNYIDAHQPFTLYISAQCKCMPDRIPEHLGQIPGSILSNPKLAEVKFGSFNSLEEEEEQGAKTQPSPETVTLSAILICLPFRQLREAFAIMREKGVLSGGLAQAIVVEREARRLYALRVLVEEARQQQQAPKNQEVNQDRIRELGFREFFTTKSVHDGVVRVQIELQREWVGMVYTVHNRQP